MSRSKGNVVLLSTLVEQGIDPMALRYLLLTAHYRSKINLTDESITAAQNGLNNLRDDLAELLAVEPAVTRDTDTWSQEARRVRDAFHTAINDDLDLPTALSITREVARNNRISPAERVRLLLDFDRVLGLRLDSIKPKARRALSDELLELVRQRDEARAAREALQKNDYRSASAHAARAASAAPQNPDFWFLYAYAARLAGQFSESVDAYNR